MKVIEGDECDVAVYTENADKTHKEDPDAYGLDLAGQTAHVQLVNELVFVTIDLHKIEENR